KVAREEDISVAVDQTDILVAPEIVDVLLDLGRVVVVIRLQDAYEFASGLGQHPQEGGVHPGIGLGLHHYPPAPRAEVRLIAARLPPRAVRRTVVEENDLDVPVSLP